MKKIIKIFSVLLILTSIISGCVGILVFGYLSKYKNSHVEYDMLDISAAIEPTVFYRYEYTDRKHRIGREVLIEDASLDGGVKYHFIPFAQIPQNMINAFIAIEDKRFFDHSGIDMYRSIHAVFNYFLKGKSSFGGSTITQQLVKNLTGNDELTSTRKIKEAFCALNLEDDLDKSEIIEHYQFIRRMPRNWHSIGAFLFQATFRAFTERMCNYCGNHQQSK